MDRGCLLINEYALNRETQGRYKADYRIEQLEAISEAMANTFSISELMETLALLPAKVGNHCLHALSFR